VHQIKESTDLELVVYCGRNESDFGDGTDHQSAP